MIRLLTTLCSIIALLLACVPESADALPSNCFTGSLPTTPQDPSYTLELFHGSSDRAHLVLWRQACPNVAGETAVLVRITPVTAGPFVCSVDFVIVQNSVQFDARIITITGSPFCGDLFVPSTFLLVEGFSQPAFNEAGAFRLIYEGSTVASVDVPAGEGGTPHDPTPRLANISTRGFVGSGDNVLIGGFIVGGHAICEPICGTVAKRVLVRAIGPSLADFGVPGALANPFLRLYVGQVAIAENDDWQVTLPLCQNFIIGAECGTPSDITTTGLAPTNPQESAILITLSPGPYTAIVSGVGGATGIGLVEVFEVPFDP